MSKPDYLLNGVMHFEIEKHASQRWRGFGWVSIHAGDWLLRAIARGELVAADPLPIHVKKHDFTGIVRPGVLIGGDAVGG